MAKAAKKAETQTDLEEAIERVKMKVTSEKHAFDPDGTKYWQGTEAVVPIAVAEDWMKHGRAEPL